MMRGTPALDEVTNTRRSRVWAHRDRDDVVIAPGFDVGGIEPDIGPLALDRPGEEGRHPLVDLTAQA